MGVINGFFEGNGNSNWGNNNGGRRHGRHEVEPEPVEDPNPRRRSVYAGLSLAEASRRGLEEDSSDRRSSAGRRLGRGTESSPTQQYVTSPGTGISPMSPSRPGLVGRTSSNGTALEQHRERQRASSLTNGSTADNHRPSLTVRIDPHESSVEPVSAVWNTPEARRSITRSRALASRQGRWRNGSRDAPVLVESDNSDAE